MRIQSDGWSRSLEVGEVITFGRGDAEVTVDLVLADDERLHRIAGSVEALEDGWQLRNLGRWLRLSVADRRGPGRDLLGPNRSMNIAWSHTRVEILLGDTTVGFDVIAEQHDDDINPAVAEGVGLTVEPFRIDHSAGYFRALVALCATALDGGGLSAAPSNAEIAVRLNASGRERRHLTAKAVERRLQYCSTPLWPRR